MISVKGPLNSGIAVGDNGVATSSASTTHPVIGKVLAVYLRYNDSPPAATTDVSVATTGTDIPGAITLLSIANSATDAWYYPRNLTETNDGTDITYDGTRKVYEPYVIHDKVIVTINQANAGDSVDAWLILEQ